MADAHFVRGGKRRSVAVVEITALDQDRQALARLLPQRIRRALHEVGIDDGLVVVDEDNGIVAQHGGAGQPHVADGAVTAKAHALARPLGRNLRHAVRDTRCLDIGNDGHVERGMRVNDLVHAL